MGWRAIDTPLHVHEREDEYFFILEGEHVFQIGEETLQVGPGGFVVAPRGTHTLSDGSFPEWEGSSS